MRTFPRVAVTALMCLSLISPLSAKNPGPANNGAGGKGGPQGGRGGMAQKMAQKLGLTEEQAKKIEGLVSRKKTLTMKNNAQIKIIKAESEYMWMAEKIDAAGIKAKYTEIEKLKREEFLAGCDLKMALASMLTMDQRMQVMQHFSKGGKKGHRGGKRGNRQGNQRNQRQGNHNRRNQRNQWNNQRQGNQNNNGGGHNNYPQQGGYNNYPPQGGYNNYPPQGNQGYDGGYDFDSVTDDGM